MLLLLMLLLLMIGRRFEGERICGVSTVCTRTATVRAATGAPALWCAIATSATAIRLSLSVLLPRTTTPPSSSRSPVLAEVNPTQSIPNSYQYIPIHPNPPSSVPNPSQIHPKSIPIPFSCTSIDIQFSFHSLWCWAPVGVAICRSGASAGVRP